eukprot:1669759-Lingulodinium_polyedra.AAC.1
MARRRRERIGRTEGKAWMARGAKARVRNEDSEGCVGIVWYWASRRFCRKQGGPKGRVPRS